MRYWLAVGIAAILCASPFAFAQGSKHFIQVELLKTIKAKKAKVGDVVKARAVQAIVLPGGITIPEGSTLVGEVRAVDEKSIAISFDEAEIKGKTTPAKLSIRGAMMPGEAPMRSGDGSAPVAASTPGNRPMQGAPTGVGERTKAAAETTTGSSAPVAGPAHAVAAQTGTVIGMPGVTLEVDEGPQHASKFATSSDKELQLKSGLQLMLAVVE
jgi:hypothetical protein